MIRTRPFVVNVLIQRFGNTLRIFASKVVRINGKRTLICGQRSDNGGTLTKIKQI